MGTNEIDIRRGTAARADLGWRAERRLNKQQARTDEAAAQAVSIAGHNTGVAAITHASADLDQTRIAEQRLRLAAAVEQRGILALGAICDAADAVASNGTVPDTLLGAQLVSAAARLNQALAVLQANADGAYARQSAESVAAWSDFQRRWQR